MIKTKRLNLREIRPNDLYHIHQLHSLPKVDQYNTMGVPENISVTENIVSEWLKNQEKSPRTEYILIAENLQGTFLGLVAIWAINAKFRSAEIWYKLHPDFWGQGFGTEAVSKLVEFGFSTLDLHRIEAGCAVENIASSKILEKVGMTREGTKRKALPIRGEWIDNYEYAILESDWRS